MCKFSSAIILGQLEKWVLGSTLIPSKLHFAILPLIIALVSDCSASFVLNTVDFIVY